LRKLRELPTFRDLNFVYTERSTYRVLHCAAVCADKKPAKKPFNIYLHVYIEGAEGAAPFQKSRELIFSVYLAKK